MPDDDPGDRPRTAIHAALLVGLLVGATVLLPTAAATCTITVEILYYETYTLRIDSVSECTLEGPGGDAPAIVQLEGFVGLFNGEHEAHHRITLAFTNTTPKLSSTSCSDVTWINGTGAGTIEDSTCGYYP